MNKKSLIFVRAFLIVSVLLVIAFIPGCVKHAKITPASIITYTVKGSKDYAYMVNTIQASENGDYIIAGSVINSSDNSDVGGFVVKVDRLLNPLWAKFIPCDSVWAIPIKNNGIAVLSTDLPNISYITILNSNGDVVWSKKYTDITGSESAPFIQANAIIQTKDEGFAIIGKGIIKLDRSGNVEWAKQYSGQGTYRKFLINGSAITELKNGNFISIFSLEDPPLLGAFGGLWGCCNDFLVVKIDAKGNIIFARRVGRELSNEIPETIITENNGSFLISGNAVTNDPDNSTSTISIPVAFFNKNGNLTSLRDFVIKQGAYFISKTPDGFIGAGGGIIKFDKKFNPVWAKKNSKLSVSFAAVYGNTFVASANDADILMFNKNVDNHFYLIRGDIRKFNLRSFHNFDVTERSVIPDINRLINLTVSDIRNKISVVPANLEFTDISLKKTQN